MEVPRPNRECGSLLLYKSRIYNFTWYEIRLFLFLFDSRPAPELLNHFKVYLFDIFGEKMYACMSLILLCLTFVTVGFAQTADTTQLHDSSSLEGAIEATASIESRHVPQNRTLTYTVNVSWNGDLERYEIVAVEEPKLTNLDVVSTSSADWVGVVEGIKKAVKKYEFVLSPNELGMAYIDATVIEYKDKAEEKTRRLITNRLEVEVGDPIVEHNNTFAIVAGLGFLAVIGASIAGFIFVKRRREREAELQHVQDTVPVEERYLSQLKTEVDLQTPDKAATFSVLSKLFKQYLSDRYDVSAMELTTKEITDHLNKMAVSDKIVGQTEEILNACDVAKFSGSKVEHGTLERVYTLLEDILNQNKSYYIDHSQN